MYLFIDTTQNITIGLLGEDLKWIDYQYLISKKSSAELHYLIYEMLSSRNKDVTSITGLIYCAGPGSYTGMRISEGLSNIFEWSKIKVNSFYHFEVPAICGANKGIWGAKAFKGEYFLYSWNQTVGEKILVPENELESRIGNKEIYFGHEAFLEKSGKLSKDFIKDCPELIFKYVLENNLCVPLYYYRPLEEEFSRKNE
ncbi:MAG: tRNA threonylcarbamoyladenosine biosynthesis protein TsaB [Bacteriovoracaceae bacterium]|jgi:tRNA threonylcarbamoyladenosine biosynthesis protein TsaB